MAEDMTVGMLYGAFNLENIHAEISAFRCGSQCKTAGKPPRKLCLGWRWNAFCTVLYVSVLSGSLRAVSRNVFANSKLQAEKLRDADFGDPLLVSREDELGDLASVFNDLRHRLRKTTHSRDYVNSILAGMNEAIIVTTDDGQITQVNTAAAHLLGL